MTTFGTNYGMAELRCAQAVQDAVTYYLVDGTMPNYGTLYGEKEKRLAIAIVENTSIGGGGGSVPDGNKGDVTVSGGGSQWTVNSLPQSRITGLAANLSNKQDVLVSGVNIKTINGLSLPGSGDLSITTTPAGANTQIQFNNNGVFGADSRLVFAPFGGATAMAIGDGITDTRLRIRGNQPLMVGLQNGNSPYAWMGAMPNGSYNFANNAGTSLVNFTQTSLVGINNVSPLAQLDVVNSSPSQVGFKLTAAASQSSSTFQVLNNSGAVRFEVLGDNTDPNGPLGIVLTGNTSALPAIVQNLVGYGSPFTSAGFPGSTGAARFLPGSGAGLGLQGFSNSGVMPGFRQQGHIGSTTTAQYAFINEVYKHNGAGGRTDLTSTEKAFAFYNGAYDSGGKLLFDILGGGQTTFYANDSTVVPLTVKGASGQSADSWQLLNNSGTVLTRFDNSGKLSIGSGSLNGSFSAAGINILPPSGNANGYMSIYGTTGGISSTLYFLNGSVYGLFGLSGGNDVLINGSIFGDFNIRNSQRILFSANAGSSIQAVLNANGNFGLNQSNPLAQLDILNSNASQPIVKFTGTTGAVAQITNAGGLVLPAGGTSAGTAPFKLTTQSSPLTSPEQGTFELIGNSLQFTQLVKRRGVAMTEGVLLSDITVGNSTVESSSILTAQHGANYLEIGKCEEIVIRGIIQQTSVGGGQLQVRVKYAGTTLQTITSSSGNILAGTPFEIRISSTCRSIGTNGTMHFHSVFWIDGFTNLADAVALATIDTTISQSTEVTLQWTVANANNTVTVSQGRVLCIETNK